METTQTDTTTQEGKTIALIAYLTIIGLIIAFVMNKDKKNDFAKYHIMQSLGLALTAIALSIVGFVPFIGWILNLIGIMVVIYMWIIGLINALNDKQQPVPILGKHYEKWFVNL